MKMERANDKDRRRGMMGNTWEIYVQEDGDWILFWGGGYDEFFYVVIQMYKAECAGYKHIRLEYRPSREPKRHMTIGGDDECA